METSRRRIQGLQRLIQLRKRALLRPEEAGRDWARKGWFGGDRGTRTPNLGIANAALSQLSYIPKERLSSGVSDFRVQNEML